MEINNISKEDFLKINENTVMFITNPGRMGDEDGCTFIIKDSNEYKIYRIDGWSLIHPKKDIKENEYISLSDAVNQFPKWHDAWKNKGNSKYKYLYMGFGNGLSIDKSIYREYKPYLDKKVEEFLKDKEDKEGFKYGAIYNVWDKAFIAMIKEYKIQEKKFY